MRTTRRDCGAGPRVVQVAAMCPGESKFGGGQSRSPTLGTPRMRRRYGSSRGAFRGVPVRCSWRKHCSPIGCPNWSQACATRGCSGAGPGEATLLLVLYWGAHPPAKDSSGSDFGRNAPLSYKRSGSLLGKDHMQNPFRCRSGLSRRKRRNRGTLNGIRHAKQTC
jgi:hypothetical protein